VFVEIGQRIVNVDLINHVRKINGPDGKLSALRVHFASGETIDVRDPDEMVAITAALTPNKKARKDDA